MKDLRASDFFRQRGDEIDRFLSTAEEIPCETAAPRLDSFIRAVQWNIEKGRRFDAVVTSLQNDPVLRWADVLLLNEADHGMIRSGNRHIAKALGAELNMHVVFGPAHIELTNGTGEDLQEPGVNRESLQGNAVLSRHPVLETKVVPLPVCFEPFEFAEKRYGKRNCVWARLLIRGNPIWVGSVHLEVRNTPSCRAGQMRYLLERLPGRPDEPHLLGGDLNSNSFPRGTLWRTLVSVGRILLVPPDRMKRRLVRPEEGAEPLFDAAAAAGFSWKGLNSQEETASAPISTLEDSDFLPEALSSLARRRLAPHQGCLNFKLDWFLARGVRALGRDAAQDPATGVVSLDPGCIPVHRAGAERTSDHSPIFVDFRIA